MRGHINRPGGIGLAPPFLPTNPARRRSEHATGLNACFTGKALKDVEDPITHIRRQV